MAENKVTDLKAEKEQRIAAIRKRRKAILISAIAGILLIILIVLLFAFLFRVRSFKIKYEGEIPYTQKEITKVLSDFEGDSLFFVSAEDVAPLLESELPYIGSVTVQRKLPCTLEITVTEAEEFYAVEVNTGIYAVTDGNLKVLRIENSIPDGTALVKGRKSSSGYDTGAQLSFSSDVGDDTIQSALCDIAAEAENSGFENISMVDVSASDSIYLIYDGRIVVRLGNTSNITSKISLAKKSIDEENETSPKGYGELNVTISGKAIFAPKDYKDIEELALYEEIINPETASEAEAEADEEGDEDGKNSDGYTDENQGDSAEGITEDTQNQ